ncbi:hypothetical protein AUEXF2481DRAFT_514245 [Aureobasidium subglaciale EXF-2481]|uniref:Uncharacterized protein n=1 Tax=Aureobasidium subglaciale (strain EXF-2481) TaxID=1043005 RepID=A0A074YA40_AURSE|nr:uncharacterized protein AUEXF2481DRAFT_514245 [Aureobasidium subglaciale EXF-2481]KEQ91057.1 hypothetical protein AUEXF2481DRAFT_514245 [Aureobasidium subglaciale EXF-2481]
MSTTKTWRNGDLDQPVICNLQLLLVSILQLYARWETVRIFDDDIDWKVKSRRSRGKVLDLIARVTESQMVRYTTSTLLYIDTERQQAARRHSQFSDQKSSQGKSISYRLSAGITAIETVLCLQTSTSLTCFDKCRDGSEVMKLKRASKRRQGSDGGIGLSTA